MSEVMIKEMLAMQMPIYASILLKKWQMSLCITMMPSDAMESVNRN